MTAIDSWVDHNECSWFEDFDQTLRYLKTKQQEKTCANWRSNRSHTSGSMASIIVGSVTRLTRLFGETIQWQVVELTSLTTTISTERYPTHILSPETQVVRDDNCSHDRLQLMRAIPMANIASRSLLSTKELFAILDLIPTSGISVQELCKQTPIQRGRQLLLSILWLAKMGLVHLAPVVPSPSAVEERELVSV